LPIEAGEFAFAGGDPRDGLRVDSKDRRRYRREQFD